MIAARDFGACYSCRHWTVDEERTATHPDGSVDLAVSPGWCSDCEDTMGGDESCPEYARRARDGE